MSEREAEEREAERLYVSSNHAQDFFAIFSPSAFYYIIEAFVLILAFS